VDWRDNPAPLRAIFPGIEVHEAVILQAGEASRFFPVENGNFIIIAGHTHRPVFANLSLTERRLLETGIGSRGVRRKAKADPVYFNTGSCVHPRCITGIEITAEKNPDNEALHLRCTLVKWGFCADAPCAETKTGADAGDAFFPIAIRRTVLE
jgi:hypothetical protein